MSLGLDWAFEMAREDGESVAKAGVVETEVSADGKRVIWTVTPLFTNSNESHDPLSRFYLRSLGRQIKLVDAGAGVDHTRRIAAHLESTDNTVVAIGTQTKTVTESFIYYRRDNRKTAEQIRDAMPAPIAIEEIKAEGWVDVIVILGQDAAPSS